MLYRLLGSAICLIATLSSAFGQSSTALVKVNPRSQYDVLKAVAFSSNLGRPDPRHKSLNIRLCGGEMNPGATDGLTSELIDLAHQVYKATQYLTWTGYPQSLWQPLLSNYERAELSHIVEGKKSGNDYDMPEVTILIQQLNDYRGKSGSSLPEISWIGCGGPGGGLLKVKTVPSRGEVWVIPVFFHTLCTKQQLNPDDRDQCNHGEDYSDGDEIAGLAGLSGQYRYVVTWPGGVKKKGTVSFSKSGSVWTIR
jgi:hypothetical protein